MNNYINTENMILIFQIIKKVYCIIGLKIDAPKCVFRKIWMFFDFSARLNSTDDLDDDSGSIYAGHQGKVFSLDEDDYSD